MTDERLGDGLWVALAQLPRGAGVVFRHYATVPAERRRLLAAVARVCRARRLMLVVAGKPIRDWPGHGRIPTHGRRGSLTWPAHDRREAIAAARAGALLVFVSPVFATRSHPGAVGLGPLRAAAIARGLPVMRIALGGMDAGRFRRVAGLGFDGWAAIDAWQVVPPHELSR
ncbi:thiamine phosphate synthase [uncultured Sphingomonas sp.]|uniref:thiamine phosphate synthase n=1 Tax=uncultured Sphingomonas sp. TaxID=158754 RepID=UPI0035CC1509